MIDLHKLDKFRLKDREREFYGCTGDSGNGVFKVYVDGKSFRVIASNGMGWEHVSVSRIDRNAVGVYRLHVGSTGDYAA